MDGKYLKKINGACIFLKEENGTYKCEIYDFRPECCKRWPFVKIFWKIKLTRIFNCPGLAKINNLF